MVNTTIDGTGSPSGDLSLRQAVNLANALGAAETITFDPTVFATPQTITLTQGQLELSDTGGIQTITAPAAGVTINGNHAGRDFQVDRGVTASMSGLTIGGGLFSNSGGGIAVYGTATLTDCTISGNSATRGGGIEVSGAATLTDCTVSDNSAGRDGGGVYSGTDGGTATLTDCTINGNSAVFGGGLDNGGGTAKLTDCTISGNSGTSGGGLENLGGQATIIGCTISGNFATGGGGLYNASGGTTTITDTIIAGNTDSGSPSDISGDSAVDVTDSYNLVGTGGSGGLLNGVDGNIVLTSLTGLRPRPAGRLRRAYPDHGITRRQPRYRRRQRGRHRYHRRPAGLPARQLTRHRRLPDSAGPRGQYHDRRHRLALG